MDLFSSHNWSQVEQWNEASLPIVDSCIHGLIERHVKQKPDAEAVHGWDASFTFIQLDEYTTRLAKHLVGLGVGKNTRTLVPLCFEKSSWTIVAMLAVLKAGGAFVLLDCSHPVSRLSEITASLGSTLMISSREQQMLSVQVMKTVLIVDEDFMNFMREDQSNDLPIVSTTDAAYLIFTSGTTGKPKGIVMEHAAFSTSAIAHGKSMLIRSSSRVLQFASYQFDACLVEILTTLIFGGCVCIPNEANRIEDIAGVISKMKIDWAVLVPSYLQFLSPQAVPGLRTLALAGEAMAEIHISVWAKNVNLINAYGPSECAVAAAINSSVTEQTEPTNIGYPVGGRCWIVYSTNHHQLAPIGCIGELIIEGPTLARGYWNDVEKTQSSFIENPKWTTNARAISATTFNQQSRRRFYKTGDLVRYTPNGQLIFAGRKGTQVKINGQRVELGDIESNLAVHEAIQQSLVLIPDQGPLNKCLVSILLIKGHISRENMSEVEIVPESEYQVVSALVANIKDTLTYSLPGYMVPAFWIVVQNIPLQTSGKINRSKIKNWLDYLDPDTFLRIDALQSKLTKYGRPELHADEKLAFLLTKKVISLISREGEQERIDLQGRDFSLRQAGVDSVTAISLSNFIRKTFGVSLPISKLTDGRATIRNIARDITEGTPASADETLNRIDLIAEFRSLNERLHKLPALSSSELLPSIGCSRTFFLTGATGFLGTQILRQLLERTETDKVITLVRAPEEEKGRIRTIKAAKIARWWTDAHNEKLEVWVGDLAKSKLGLREYQWDRLCGRVPKNERVDAVIHNGAIVHWESDFETLKPANILSVFNLLVALSMNPNSQRFVFVTGGGGGSIHDVDDNQIAAALATANGYAQTKFVAELLVKAFARRTGRVLSIVKPGLVIGTVEEGVSNTDDFVWRLISSVVRTGKYNSRDSNSWLTMAGADQIAALILDTCFYDTISDMKTVVDGISQEELWMIIQDALGRRLRPLEPDDFVAAIRADVKSVGEKHNFFPVLHMLESSKGFAGGEHPVEKERRFSAAEVRLRVERSVKYMDEIGYFGVHEQNAYTALRSGPVFTRTSPFIHSTANYD